jgi:hypothetical protein
MQTYFVASPILERSLISILFSVLVSPTLMAASTWPDMIPPVRGELDTYLVAPENKIRVGAVKIEMNFDLDGFTKSSRQLLSKFDGLTATVFAYKSKVHSVEIEGSPSDQVSKMTLYNDGAKLEGPLLRHNEIIYMQIPSVDGKKQVQLTGLKMRPDQIENFFRQPTVIVRGFLHEGGKELNVIRMEDTLNAEDMGMNVYVRAPLQEALVPDKRTRNMFYFDGPNQEKYFLKSNQAATMMLTRHLGLPVIVIGKSLQGGIEINSLDLSERVNADISCGDRLLGELLASRKR